MIKPKALHINNFGKEMQISTASQFTAIGRRDRRKWIEIVANRQALLSSLVNRAGLEGFSQRLFLPVDGLKAGLPYPKNRPLIDLDDKNQIRKSYTFLSPPFLSHTFNIWIPVF